MNKIWGIRVEEDVETAGLDVSEHGMWGYPEFYIPVPGGYGTGGHGTHVASPGRVDGHRDGVPRRPGRIPAGVTRSPPTAGRGLRAAPRPRARNRRTVLSSGSTTSRLGVEMAHMLNAGKSKVFAFAAHIRTR